MLLYDSFGPNPRAMRMFLAEKKIEIPTKTVDIMKAENRQTTYNERNPGGQLPALELDSGRCLGETVAIWDYLEERHPVPALIGETPEERAETHQWQRRVELNITENIYNGFRFAEGLDMFRDRLPCEPEAAPGLKRIAQARLKWLDGLIAGRDYIVPNRFTTADIILYCCLDFAAGVGQILDPSLGNLHNWFNRIGNRPSARTSLHPAAEKLKMKG
ncbi:MAG: glutathione S-transferase [Deltaproteobacteria bacterium]|nr:glutathione S-transferase [Deltaproteobacteria bacterium]MBV8452209.1 glutathione S-transferase [Deltaproteobacteria bacterium]